MSLPGLARASAVNSASVVAGTDGCTTSTWPALATIDTGAHRILLNHVWQSFEPRRLLQSNGLGTMGYALPSAIAASLLFPKRPVLAMMGEAGLDMVIGEMALLAKHLPAAQFSVYAHGHSTGGPYVSMLSQRVANIAGVIAIIAGLGIALVGARRSA